jgi:hypothetical protein
VPAVGAYFWDFFSHKNVIAPAALPLIHFNYLAGKKPVWNKLGTKGLKRVQNFILLIFG